MSFAALSMERAHGAPSRTARTRRAPVRCGGPVKDLTARRRMHGGARSQAPCRGRPRRRARAAGDVASAEDGRPRDEMVGAGGDEAARVRLGRRPRPRRSSPPEPAARIVSERRATLTEGAREEGLPAPAGVDGHHEDEVDERERPRPGTASDGPRVDRDARRTLRGRAVLGEAVEVRLGLDVDRDARARPRPRTGRASGAAPRS